MVVLFVILLILMFITFEMLTGVVFKKKKSDTVEESIQNRQLSESEAEIEINSANKINVVTQNCTESELDDVYNVPAGIFISSDHTWIRIHMKGEIKVGIDDFVQKTIGKIDSIRLPKEGTPVRIGDPLFSITQNSRIMTFPSPLTGEVLKINDKLHENINLVKTNPYECGWICQFDPHNLSEELQTFRLGSESVSWYKQEIDKFHETVTRIHKEENHTNKNNGDPIPEHLDNLDDKVWEEFSKSFIHNH